MVEGLAERLEGGGGSHLTVAGIPLGGGAREVEEDAEDDPFGLPEWAKTSTLEEEAQTLNADDLLLRTSFHLSSREAAGAGTAFTAWGRVETGGFEAEVDDVTMDGDVTTGLVGFDAEWERALAGVMLSRSSGDGAYRLDPERGDDSGTVKSDLTGVYPYARLALNERVSAWGLAGAGSGTITLTQQGHGPMKTGLSLRMGALGLEGRVLGGKGPSGLAVNVKSDAMWVRTMSERSADMVGTEGDVTRVRLIVEGERSFKSAAGAMFTPSAEIGLRHDGGDAETGTGLEVGAGVRYTHGALTVEGRVRTLVAHENSGYREWGASGAVRVTPGPSGRGLTVQLRPEWGRTASASHHLWSARDASELEGAGEFEAERRLRAEMGYGFGLGGARGVLTPHMRAQPSARRGGARCEAACGGSSATSSPSASRRRAQGTAQVRKPARCACARRCGSDGRGAQPPRMLASRHVEGARGMRRELRPSIREVAAKRSRSRVPPARIRTGAEPPSGDDRVKDRSLRRHDGGGQSADSGAYSGAKRRHTG